MTDTLAPPDTAFLDIYMENQREEQPLQSTAETIQVELDHLSATFMSVGW